MESERVSVTVKSAFSQDDKKKKATKTKLNKLRSIKLSKSPSLKPSTRRPKPHLRSIVVDFSSTDFESPSPPCSSSSSRTDVSQTSAPLLTRRSSFKKGLRTLTRMSSKKSKRPSVKKSTAEHDRSSVVSSSGSSRSVKTSPRASEHSSSIAKTTKTTSVQPKALTRKASLRPLRVSTKSKRVSTAEHGGVGVEKATCSSALKGSKFGGDASACGEDSAAKVCPFSYCSLHGHRRANVPPLQRLISIRRRLMRNDRSKSAHDRATRRAKRPGKAKNEAPISPAEELSEESVNQAPTESDSFESRSSRTKLDEQVTEVADSRREEKENLEPEPGPAKVIQLKDQKYVKMWRLMYKHTVRGGSGSAENPSPVNTNREQEEPDRTEQIDAVKLVQQAFDEILLPEIQELSPGPGPGQEIEPKMGTENRASKSWSGLKKVLILKRFVKAMEKVKRVNRGPPRQIPLQPEPEPERVNLRRMTSEERKNADEWMIDFALRHVVSKLEPAQQRRVAMLVKAFESILPVPDLDSSPRSSVEDRDRTGSVQTCVEADEGDNGEASSTSHRAQENENRTTLTGGKTDEALESKNAGEGKPEPENAVDSSLEPKKFESENAHEAKPKPKKANLSPEPKKLESENAHEALESENGHEAKPEPKKADLSPEPRKFESENAHEARESGNAPEAKPEPEKAHLSPEPKNFESENAHKALESKNAHEAKPEPEKANLSPEPKSENAHEAKPKPEKADSSDEPKKFETETADTEPLQGPGSDDAAEEDAQSGKQSYMRLWGFVYSHMVSTLDEPDPKSQSPVAKNRESGPKIDAADSEKAILRRIEAIKLIEKAIDDVVLPENQDSPPPESQSTKIPAESLPENPTGPLPGKPISRNWSNLKKMILLRRFITALEGTKGFNPRGPRFLAAQVEAEPERVRLRRLEMEERKSAEQWMVDHALQQAVTRLTPARKRKVQLLVEAFETVTPTV